MIPTKTKLVLKVFLALVCIGIFGFLVVLVYLMPTRFTVNSLILKENPFEIQSVDTMKYSRDTAREKLSDPSFDLVIERHMRAAADIGATHVAIATPYDAEFLPFLERWVSSARRQGLSIWFRGNFSGWENWFEYPRIGRQEHLSKIKIFINDNPDLFADGDIFSPCPECENGGPGDPRMTGDVIGHRKFIIDEYNATRALFDSIGKDVETGYFSMNGDVARLVMDKETTSRVGGIVVIDHYVPTMARMEELIRHFGDNVGAKVVLGEFGAPIPDINGPMDERAQAAFIKGLMEVFYETRDIVIGINYWVLEGGSTKIVTNNGMRLKAFDVIGDYYKAPSLVGTVLDEHGQPLSGVSVETDTSDSRELSDRWGNYQLFVPKDSKNVVISYEGFATATIPVSAFIQATTTSITILNLIHPTLEYRISSFLYSMRQKWGI